jgi:hypothetical protein
MLGDMLGESSGKIIGTKVLPSDGQQVKIEASFQGSGNILGVPITDVGTYWQTFRPGGVLYGEGHVVLMSQDGDVVDWNGFGVGRATGPAPQARYGVAGSAQTASERLARVAAVTSVIEYEVDAQGGYRWKMWEWK